MNYLLSLELPLLFRTGSSICSFSCYINLDILFGKFARPMVFVPVKYMSLA